jgi:ankyrin repeat protein
MAQLIPFARLVQQLQSCVDALRGEAGAALLPPLLRAPAPHWLAAGCFHALLDAPSAPTFPSRLQPLHPACLFPTGDAGRSTLLHAAVSGGHIAALQLLGTVAPSLAGLGDGQQRVPLLLAIDMQQEEAARLLLLLSLQDATSPDATGRSALMAAHELGWSALMQRVQEEQPSEWQMLLRRWLTHCAERGSERQLRAVLWAAAATGVDVGNIEILKPPSSIITLLHMAVDSWHVGAARLLLEAAPALALRAPDRGRTPLHCLIYSSSRLHTLWESELLRLLVAVPGAAMAKDSLGRVPLHLACEHNRCSPADVALLAAAAPEAVGVLDRDRLASPLLNAVQRGSLEVVEALLAAAPAHSARAVAAVDKYGCSPWSAALDQPRPDVVAALLAAVIEGTDGGGRDAALDLLLGSEAADVVDDVGKTLLHFAARRRSPAVLQLLLEAQLAPATATDVEGFSALHDAAAADSAAAVTALLATAPQLVAARTVFGATPLACAASDGCLAALEVLLAAAPNTAVAPSDHAGRLPLHWAAGNGHDAAVALLVAAAPHAAAAVDEEGASPLLIALAEQH